MKLRSRRVDRAVVVDEMDRELGLTVVVGAELAAVGRNDGAEGAARSAPAFLEHLGSAAPMIDEGVCGGGRHAGGRDAGLVGAGAHARVDLEGGRRLPV